MHSDLLRGATAICAFCLLEFGGGEMELPLDQTVITLFNFPQPHILNQYTLLTNIQGVPGR